MSSDPPAGPGQDLVKQLLEQMELKYVEEEDTGDLAVVWESFRTYFMFRGEGDQRIFSVRSYYDRAYPLDEKPQLVEILDDWNRSLLWPKVYSQTTDDGTVHVIAESHLIVGLGVSADQFMYSMVTWVRAAIDFNTWLGQQITH